MTGRRPPGICDVAPRDGLQNEKVALNVETRVALVDRLSAVGVARIEAGSFVNPHVVPQMADAEAVFAAITRRSGVEYSALILNAKGAMRAIAARAERANFAIAASNAFNVRNQRTSVSESLDEFSSASRLCHAAGVPMTGTIATAFGCPFEGATPIHRVVELAQEMAARGADEIFFADTIGVAVPAQVEALIDATRRRVGDVALGAHFHDTRATGIANADAAIRCGVAWLDSSVGGFGGCPFAPAATGNIATEDVAYLLRQSDISNTLDIAALIETGRWLGAQLKRPSASALARAGVFPEGVSPAPAAAAS